MVERMGRVILVLMSRVRAIAPLLAPFAAVLAALVQPACSAADEHPTGQTAETVGSLGQAVTGPSAFTIKLPNRMQPQAAAVWAGQGLRLADGVRVRRSTNRFGRVVNIGNETTELGAEVVSGSVWAGNGAFLRSGARVEGDLFVAGGYTKQTGVVVTV